MEQLAPILRERLVGKVKARTAELEDYQGLVFYLLYYRYLPVFVDMIER